MVRLCRPLDRGGAIDDGNAESAARLCRLLEGNPLAIGLAATWVRVLPLSRICGEIEHGLDLLTSRHGAEQCERFELHALARGYLLEKREEWPELAAELSQYHSRYYLAVRLA